LNQAQSHGNRTVIQPLAKAKGNLGRLLRGDDDVVLLSFAEQDVFAEEQVGAGDGALEVRFAELRSNQFSASQSGFEDAQQAFLLSRHRLLRIQLLFERQARLGFGQAQQAFAADQPDEVYLDVLAVNHGFILLEIRRIATGG
jgi:hypothetical protein